MRCLDWNAMRPTMTDRRQIAWELADDARPDAEECVTTAEELLLESTWYLHVDVRGHAFFGGYGYRSLWVTFPFSLCIIFKKEHKDDEEMDVLDPKVDFVFKKIFGSEENKDVLLAFLNEALKETEQKPLTQISLVNPFIDKTMVKDKLSILDVCATTAEGKQINLEIQLFDKYDIQKRTLFYWRNCTADNWKKGSNTGS